MKDFVYFYYLSRPLNVLITLVAFALGAFLGMGKEWTFVQDGAFWIGMGILAAVTATGYWVNDAFDFKIDRVNKPRKVIVNAHLSVKKVLTAYFIVIALLLACSYFLQDTALFMVTLSAVALLFGYAALLKRTTVVGNLVIAALTALVLYYAGLHYSMTVALLWTLVFAFEVTFIREVVKDIEDIEGDLHFKLQTLPIRIGIRGAKGVVYFAIFLLWATCYGPIIQAYALGGQFNWPYMLASTLLVQAPLIYLAIILGPANTPGDFSYPSRLLKMIIISGMVSMLFLI